ncbi:unannotated protein [freshwater metagenome]|uniref:Unannotated protein n=1 Tax=freshwater metagenome TaxID=449393 RepID=A0A6J6NV45_9ZZZZ
MVDTPSFLGNSQDEVIVLRSFETWSESTYINCERPAYHRKMAAVVLCTESFGRPIGLIKRLSPRSIEGDEVFIGVEVVDSFVGPKNIVDEFERVEINDVVVVQQHDEIASGRCQRIVRRRNNSAIVFSEGDLDSGITDVVVEHFSDMRARRRIIDEM